MLPLLLKELIIIFLFAVNDFDISDHFLIYCTRTLNERPSVGTLDDSQGTETNAWKKVNIKRMNKHNLIYSRNCPKKFWKNIKTNKTYKSNTSKVEPNAWY